MHHGLVEEPEEVGETNSGEDAYCDEKVLVGFPGGGLALQHSRHQGLSEEVWFGRIDEAMGYLDEMIGIECEWEWECLEV